MTRRRRCSWSGGATAAMAAIAALATIAAERSGVLRPRSRFASAECGREATFGERKMILLPGRAWQHGREIHRLLPGFHGQAGQVRPWARRAAPSDRELSQRRLLEADRRVHRGRERQEQRSAAASGTQAACKKHKA